MQGKLGNGKEIKASLLLLIITLSILSLQGCGGGGGGGGVVAPPAPSLPPTGKSEGQIDANSIGISTPTDLVVRSIWQEEDAPVAQDGSFTTTVSRGGVQLLLVTDKNNRLRALTLSLPSTKSRQAEILNINSRNLAKALIFITPGILTIDPQEANDRLRNIDSLQSLNAFVSFLENKLKQKTLSELLNDPELGEQLELCLDEYFEKYPIGTVANVIGEIRSKRGVQSGKTTFVLFWLIVSNAQDLSQVRIKLYNATWRFLQVYRREIDTTGKVVRTMPLQSILPGIKPISWGLLWHMLTQPPSEIVGNLEDVVDFRNLSMVEYWVLGPGNPLFGPPVPTNEIPSYKKDIALTWVMNFGLYLAFPIVDIILGYPIFSPLITEMIKDPEIFYKIYNTFNLVLETFDNFTEWKSFIEDISQGRIDWKNRKKVIGRIIDLVNETIPILLDTNIIQDLILSKIGPEAFVKLKITFEIFNKPLQVAHLIAVTVNWAATPMTAKAVVYRQ